MTDQASPEGQVLPEGQPAQAPEGEPKQPETAAKPEGETQEQPKEPEGEKKLKGVGKRLHQLTSERDYWKSLAIQGQQQPQQPQAQPEPVKTLKDFEYDEGKYTAYLFERARSEAVEAARKEASSWREQQEAQTRRQSFDAKLADLADDNPEFYSLWETTPVSEPMGKALMASENGADVALFLASNQDIALRLFYMPPIEAALEVGSIAARLKSERTRSQQKPVSQAPPPPPKVEALEPGMSVSASSPESDKLSTRDWLKRREKELAKRKA